MLPLVKAFLFAMLMFIPLSCGDDTSSKKGPILKPDPNLPPSKEFVYTREDAACAEANAASWVYRGNVWSYGNNRVSALQESFLATRGAPSLRGAFIKDTIVNFTAESTCDESENRCREKTTNRGNSLPICRSDGNYQRTSIEGVALTAYKHLDNAFSFYQTLPNAKSFKPIDFYVLPRFLTTSGGQTYVRADNAAYTPTRNAVYIFPRGSLSDKIWPGVNLWESSWILAHEGSHHLFESHFTNTIKPYFPNSVLARSEALPVLKTDHPDFHPERSRKQHLFATRSVDLGDVSDALNEGFADLFAYYVVGEKSEMINGLTCFTQGRDVRSRYFKTGTPKVLSSTAIETFFASHEVLPQPPSGYFSCDEADYQDIHHIGAIIIHGLDRIFAEAPTVRQSANPTKEKGHLALRWLDNAAYYLAGQAHRTAPLSVRDAMMGLVLEGVKLGAASDGQTLTQSQCQTVREVFPVYASSWLNGTLRCQ